MTLIVVDSSTIISCAMNCLLWVFDELRGMGHRFIVPTSVKDEVIDSGLRSQKFRFEAIRVMHHFVNGTFEIYKGDLKKETSELLEYANSSFYIKNRQLKVLQDADAEVAALAIKERADAILTDERTLRMFVENPDAIKEFLQRKFHSAVRTDEDSLHRFAKYMASMPMVRSADLMVYAFENGVFGPTIERCNASGMKDCKKNIISGLLFALKYSGCAISFEEVNDYVNLMLRKKHG
jgi:hypothetical protein